MSDVSDIGVTRRRKIIERKLAIKRRLVSHKYRPLIDYYLDLIADTPTLTEQKDDKDKE